MHHLSMPKLISLMVLFPLLVACESWEPREAWGTAVWADDNQSLAAVLRGYELETNNFSLGGTARYRNYTHQIYTGSSSSIKKLALRHEKENGRVISLYYSRDDNQDYVLVHSSANEQAGGINFRQYFADGSKRHLRHIPAAETVLECNGVTAHADKDYDMVPSPDGKLLGWASVQLNCDGLFLVVEFINGETGETVEGPNTYALPTDSSYHHHWEKHYESDFGFAREVGPSDWYRSSMRVAWSEEDELIVAFEGATLNGDDFVQWNDDTRGYRLAPNESPISFDSLDRSCLSPKTTSSDINANGERLTRRDGKLLILPTTDSSNIFGCNPGK